MEDNQNLFTLSNKNIDNSNDEIFQKTPVFNFDGNGTLIKKKETNNNNKKKEIKPLNLQGKFNLKNNNNFKDIISEKKEENNKFDNIKLILGEEILNSINSQKWEVKKEGYKIIYNLIKNNEKNLTEKIKELIEYFEIKIKIYEETNFNVIIEIIKIFNFVISNNLISKEKTMNIIFIYYDKIIDSNLNQYVIDLINSSFNNIGINIIIKQLIQKLIEKNHIKLLNEYSNYFIKIINENNLNNLPQEDIIKYCIYMINNTNSQVINSGINLLCNIYKFIGNDIKLFLKDIKEFTLKKIYEQFNKIKLVKNNNINKFPALNKNSKKENLNSREIINCKKDKNEKLYKSIDITKKLNKKILNDISNGKWIEKKTACEFIIKIINESNMNILPNGLKELFIVINNKINDSNKNLVKLLINILSKLIESLKYNFKIYSNDIVVNLIQKLSDKNEIIRKEIQSCFEKWITFVGIDSLITNFPPFLKNESSEIRLEILNFMIKHNNKIAESLGKIIYKEMANNLLICLQDRNINVRNKTEEVIKLSLKYISIDIYNKMLKNFNFKPTIEKELSNILNKIGNKNIKKKNKISFKNNSVDKNCKNINNLSKISLTSTHFDNRNINFSSSSTNIITNDETNESSQKRNHIFNNLKRNVNLSKKYKTDKTVNSKLLNNLSMNKNSSFISLSINNSFSSQNSNSLIKNLNSQRQPVNNYRTILFHNLKNKKIKNNNLIRQESHKIIINNNIFVINSKINKIKNQRYDLDKKNDFNIYKMSLEEFNEIKELSKNIFTNNFIKKIFSSDFEEEVSAYQLMINQLKRKENIIIYYDNLDIILKIIGYRVIKTKNTSLIKFILEYLDSLIILIIEYNYILNDVEYKIIFSILIKK